MKIANLTPEDVVGRWIYFRRTYGYHGAELRRGYVQERHPGNIVGLLYATHREAAAYPRRPLPTPCPLVLPLDELEIHAVVECVGVVEGVVPPD